MVPEPTRDEIRLERHERWDEMRAATRERSVHDVAEAFDVAPGALRAALRRTGEYGGRNRVVRPTPPSDVQPTDTPAPVEKSTDARLAPHRDQLGEVPDQRVAELAGVSKAVAREYRIRHGIPPYRRWGAPRAQKSEPPRRARRRRKKGRRAPAQQRLAKVHDLVGVLPDHEVAARAGVHKNTVWGYRKRRGISAPRSRSRADEAVVQPAARPTPGLARVEAHRELVGAEPDHVVAERVGVSVGTVRNYRRKHGISAAPRSAWRTRPPAPRSPPAEPEQAEVPAPTEEPTVAASPRTTFAWRVTLGDGGERIAIGDTIALVAEQVVALGLKGVLRIERIGLALTTD